MRLEKLGAQLVPRKNKKKPQDKKRHVKNPGALYEGYEFINSFEQYYLYNFNGNPCHINNHILRERIPSLSLFNPLQGGSQSERTRTNH